MDSLYCKHWPKGVPRSFTLPRTTLTYNLEVSAARYPEKTAISYYGSGLSYANQTGEIVSRGPQVFKGYWNNPQATRECFSEIDGKTFFLTGDLGYYDDEGYFFIVDRLKRMINASGFKVWPAEVESMMFGHPDIQEACVICAEDAHRGETVKAIVVLKETAKGKTTAQDIILWCKERMAAYKYPRIVEFAEALPKSGSGKVQWRLLQEQEMARAR